MTGPDIREAIDQRNRDYMLTERIRGLVRDYLAPTPSGTPEPSEKVPAFSVVPAPRRMVQGLRWRPDRAWRAAG